MTTEITIALLSTVGSPLEITDAAVRAPRADEVLVKIAGVGICHTDLTVQHGRYPAPTPIVLGHEGAGTIVAVGENVTDLAVGDHVVLTFMSCGTCPACTRNASAYCEKFQLLNMSGTCEDGSSAILRHGGPVGGHFFGQSSFATYALAHRRNAVKVRSDAPIELLGPLGCGLQTGAGTIFNVLQPAAGESCVVFGGGGVGLSAVMAARYLGCDPIILCEPVEARRALGLELGATIAIDPRAESDLTARLIALTDGGAHVICDTTGLPVIIEASVMALRTRGKIGLVGMSAIDALMQLPVLHILSKGLTVRGVVEGDSEPKTFIPFLVDLFMAGNFPLDRLVTFFEFTDINRALAAQERGEAVKPILRFA